MGADSANVDIRFNVVGLRGVKALSDEMFRLGQAQLKAMKANGQLAASGGKVITTLTRMVSKTQQLRVTMTQTAAGIQSVNSRLVTLGNTGSKSAQVVLFSWRSVMRLFVGQFITRALHRMASAFRQSVADAAKFQIRIGELQTISRDSRLEFDRWTDAVRNLSEEFDRTPTDVAEGMYQMLSNQIAEGEMAVLGMDHALKLAVATVSTTEQAVQGLTGALNSYGAGVEEASRYTDIFMTMVEEGRIRMGDLANVMGRVNMPAHQLGLTFEETAAQGIVLTRQGIKFNEAMTYQRQIMLKLLKPSEAMKGLFEKWGVASGEVAIQTWGFMGVLEKLRNEVNQHPDAFAELAKYFSRVRAVVGAGGLINNFELLNEAMVKLKSNTGAVAEAHETISQTAGYIFQKELQKIQAAILLDIGEPVMEMIVGIGEAFGGLSVPITTVINSLGFLTGAVVTLGASFAIVGIISMIASVIEWTTVMGVATMATHYWTTALWGLSAARIAAMAGLPLLFAAVAGISYMAFNAYQDKYEHIRDFAQQEVDVIKAAEAEKIMAYKKTMRETSNAIAEVMKNNIRIYSQAVATQRAELNALQRDLELQKSTREILRDWDLQEADDAWLTDQQRTQRKLSIVEPDLADIRGEIKDAIAIGGQEGVDAAMKLLKEGLALTQKDFGDDAFVWVRDPNAGRLDTARMVKMNLQYHLRNKYFAESIRLIRGIEQGTKNITAADVVRKKGAVEIFDEARERLLKEKQLETELANFRQSTADKLEAKTGLIRSEIGRMTEALRAAEEAMPWNNMKGWAQMEKLRQEGDPRNQGLNTPEGRENWEAYQKTVDLLVRLREEFEKDPENRDSFYIIQMMQELQQEAGQLGEAIPSLKDWALHLGVVASHGPKMQELTRALAATGNVESAVEKNALRQAKVLQEQKGLIIDITEAQLDGSGKITQSTEANISALIRLTNSLFDARLEAEALRAEILSMPARPKAFGGLMYSMGGLAKRFAAGGLASDIMGASVRPGEFIMNPRATSEFYPQLVNMNSRAARFGDGGTVTNTTIGDINVTVEGGGSSESTARQIASKLRRELRRGVTRLS